MLLKSSTSLKNYYVCFLYEYNIKKEDAMMRKNAGIRAFVIAMPFLIGSASPEEHPNKADPYDTAVFIENNLDKFISEYNESKTIYNYQNVSQQVVKNINLGYPVRWNQARGNYSCHSLVCKGYQTYRKKSGWFIFSYTERKNFMVIDNNWDITRDDYIDFDGYSSGLIHEGFGTFVVVRDTAWF